MKTLLRKTGQLFSSPGFANLLLLVIALLAAFGTAPPRFRFKNFSLTPQQIFHSKGFFVLLTLLAVAAAVSIARRIPRLLDSQKTDNGLAAASIISENL